MWLGRVGSLSDALITAIPAATAAATAASPKDRWDAEERMGLDLELPGSSTASVLWLDGLLVKVQEDKRKSILSPTKQPLAGD